VGWAAREVAISNQTVTICKLKPRSIIMLVSDGILAHPRDHRSLLRFLNDAMRNPAVEYNAAEAKRLTLAWAAAHGPETADDRTLLVFQWDPDAVALPTPAPAPATAS
jgi:hypothetical protein